MSRKIILLSDGTGNSAAKVWRTNVWRTFEALDLSGNDQVALYDDGVGTSSFKPLAILGGAFGFGLRRNVIALYKFACRNYRDADDELFGFGFSRGAFTIRIVMGLIDSQGLIKADNEAELDSLAKAAYRAYRRDRYKGQLRLERPYQWVRNKFGPHYPPANVRRDVKIRFVGVWDTVAAYGMPVDEMTRGIHQYLWPIELPGNKLSDSVDRACQALALDEERTTFHPQLWHEPADNRARDSKSIDSEAAESEAVEPAPNAPEIEHGRRRFIKGERISQVWFAGVHTNVGGGYPDDSLAYIPFVWMITEAQRCGLRFKSDAAKPPRPIADPDTFKNAISKRDKDGRLYDPRKGLGGYYRYGPRKLVPVFYPEAKKKEDDEVEVQRAKIHESVFKRIDNSAQAYAPIGLPPLYDVVKDDGEIVTPDQYRNPPATKPFESNAAAASRAEAQEHIWNDVWKRRIVYFATVGATLWLFAFPLLRSQPRDAEFTNPLRWVSDIIRVVGGFLPGFAETWINGFARAPRMFVFLLALVVFLTWLGGSLASRISVRMGTIWRGTPSAPKGLPHGGIYALRSHPLYIGFHEGLKQTVAPAFFAILFVYLGLTFASHLLYNVQDVAGWVCVDSKVPPKKLLKNEKHTADFAASDPCKSTGISVEANGKYSITVTVDEAWSDGGIPSELGGFYTTDAPHWYQRLALMLGVPLRRELTRPWFRLVLRYGGVGGEEVFLDPDRDGDKETIVNTPFVPTRSGELFIFVNDAVLGIPGLYDVFYWNNKGTGKLTVTRK
jgi:uncharacterized protein (DUF2235 family)